MKIAGQNAHSKFVATTVHLDHITTALNCLTPFGIKEDVLIYLDKDGLSFVRENNHVIKIQLLLSKELFMSYSYENDELEEGEEDHMKLCVKINHILDSVNIMNKNFDDIVECTLSYNGYSSPFVLIFEDSMISERVEYSTYLIKDMDNTGLVLDKDQMIFECIIKGDVIYSALKDLKEINCKECYIYAKTVENGENIFALISKSQLGFSKIKLPSSRSILEKLEIFENDSTTLCYDVPVIAFFDFTLFDKIRMSTKIASKVLFRMDVHGLLSVNILSQTDDIIISDRRKNSNYNNTTTSKKPLQLPKDYPGIVSEICMLEKESINQNAQNEIELLMNIDELGEFKKKTIKTTKLSFNPYNPGNSINESEINNDSNLLNLTTGDENDNNHDTFNSDNDNDDSSLAYSTTDLPLFF